MFIPYIGQDIGFSHGDLKAAINKVHSYITQNNVISRCLFNKPFHEVSEKGVTSAIIGDIARDVIVSRNPSTMKKNRPNVYPDIISTTDQFPSIEIKTMSNKSTPWCHSSKDGHVLCIRYNTDVPNYTRIWEVRYGKIEHSDFKHSKSGTCRLKTEKYGRLQILFFDKTFCPYKDKSRYLKHIPQRQKQKISEWCGLSA